MTKRRVRADLALLVLIAAATAVAFAGGFSAAADDPPADDWPARVYRVCEQYAGLDLSGLAPLCVDAGYSDRVYVQPTGAPLYWPHVIRTVHPEDLDR